VTSTFAVPFILRTRTNLKPWERQSLIGVLFDANQWPVGSRFVPKTGNSGEWRFR